MDQTSKPTAEEATMASMFTSTGLPLFHARTVSIANNACDSGPARRVDYCPLPSAQLLAAPSLRPTTLKPAPSTAPTLGAWPTSSLTVGIDDSDLMDDDDDDEVVDYFGSASANTRLSPSLPSAYATTASSSPWDVRDHNVPTLPSFYPLDQAAAFVPQASAPILAARVVAVLKARSISATYDVKNAKVDCVTSSLVDFRIRLYRGRGEYKHGIIIEVERREGFDISYAQDVYAILDAAESKNNTQDYDVHGNMPPMFYYEMSDDASSGEEEDDLDSLENTAGLASLRVISDIICSKGDDNGGTVEGRDFALSSLASLTSLDRMGQAAIQLSNELLYSEAHANLRNAVFSNISSPATHSSQGPPQSAPRRSLLQSLEILANATKSSTQRTSSLLADLLDQNSDLLNSLIVNIENAQLSPHAADLSCAIIKNVYGPQLESSGEITMPSHSRERLLIALMKAVSCGADCHADLERSSQMCLRLIV